MEAIKKFFTEVGDWVLGIVSIGLEPMLTGILAIALAVVIVALIITIIAVCVHKSKKKKKKARLEAEAKAKEEAERKESEELSSPVRLNKADKPAEEQPQLVVEVKEEVEEVKAEVKEEPKEEIKTEVAPEVDEAQAEAKKEKKIQHFGKWVVELKSVGEFMAKLVASNGEVMLSSEIYSSEEGARTGIATIIKWVEEGNFVIYQDKKKNYYYKLKTSGNRLICVGEIYKSKEQCENAVESVKRIARNSTVSPDLVEGARYVDYKPVAFDEENKGPKGKWRIETAENGKFSARLYASNGQLMIATEEVAGKKTALNAIESVKKNAIEGNFIVDRDKFGRYYYKLRNAQKSVICIGEAYDSLDSCTKALESVRRFAVNSIVIPE